jgi:hypothetical protein
MGLFSDNWNQQRIEIYQPVAMTPQIQSDSTKDLLRSMIKGTCNRRIGAEVVKKWCAAGNLKTCK